MSPDLRFQLDTSERLSVIGYFSDLAILLEAHGHTTEELEAAMVNNPFAQPDGTQPGTYILVGETADAPDEKRPNVPGPQEIYILTIRVLQRVRQTELLTDGAKDFHDIARAIKQALHQWQIGSAPVVYLGSEPFNNGKGVFGKDVRFEWAPPADRLAACVNPRISIAPDGSVSVQCNTPGADVFVTFNGDYPKPDPELLGPPAQKATAGQLVRAVAYAPGFLPSGIAELPFKP